MVAKTVMVYSRQVIMTKAFVQITLGHFIVYSNKNYD